MKLQEFHAKSLLSRAGLPVPPYAVAATPGEVRELASGYLSDGAGAVVVKAQVLVGGRGKAGGVKLVRTPGEAEAAATQILGMDIKGSVVRRVLVAPGAEIVRELYLAAVLDRTEQRIMLMGSAEGGVEIETLAEEQPDAIVKIHAHPQLGLQPFQAREMAFRLGLADHLKQAVAICSGLVKVMLDEDADLVEINPLAVVREDGPDGPVESLQLLDAKITLDDSALARHTGHEEMRDLDEEDPADNEARAAGLSFIRLDGDIGCMVNGAGLAMTTMDLVKHAGGEPANFLDIGGGARSEKVAEAMRLILSDASVKAILVNIFGGIARGDEVARGLVAARLLQTRDVPMVVRIVGTNAELAADILAESGGDIVTAETLDEAVAKAVELAGERGMSILIDKDTRLLVQGITGREGGFHAGQMLAYGTNVVAGVTPRKGGQTALDDAVPVFDTCRAAVDATEANASVIFVPAFAAPDAIMESVDAGIETIFCITEHIPALDMVAVVAEVEARGARLVGPNCPGATTPGEAKVGIIPGSIHKPGRVGLVSRSGTLTYEVVQAMTDAGIGQSTCVGIGGDPISGSSFIDILELFAADPDTDGVVLMGEIGGGAEEAAAAWKAEHMPDTPMVAFIAGRTAPPGRRMGHAGAIISGSGGTAEGKIEALRAAGVHVADSPTQIPQMLVEAGIQPD